MGRIGGARPRQPTCPCFPRAALGEEPDEPLAEGARAWALLRVYDAIRGKSRCAATCRDVPSNSRAGARAFARDRTSRAIRADLCAAQECACVCTGSRNRSLTMDELRQIKAIL